MGGCRLFCRIFDWKLDDWSKAFVCFSITDPYRNEAWESILILSGVADCMADYKPSFTMIMLKGDYLLLMSNGLLLFASFMGIFEISLDILLGFMVLKFPD